MFVGIQVVIENAPRLLTHDKHVPSPVTILVSIISGLIMLGVYVINHRLAKKTNSSSL